MSKERKVAIGTMTIDCLLSNYGSFLQHYALRRCLKSIGYQVARLPYADEIYEYRKGRILRLFKAFVMHALGDVLHILHIRRRASGFSIAENARRSKRVRLFKRDWKRLIGRLYEPESLEARIRIYGSDQIWSSLDGLELFPYPPPSREGGATALTYAVSGDWENAKGEAWQRKAMSVLSLYDSISVREKAGVELIKKIVSTDVAHVVDPTLLLMREDYESILPTQRFFSKPTLFCYLLNLKESGAEQVAALRRFAEEESLDFVVCAVQGAERYVDVQFLRVLSPKEFLIACRDARYVVTNSFHGTIFAMMFGRPFLSLRQECDPGSNQNTRQTELLSRLGLNDRIVEIADLKERIAVLKTFPNEQNYWTDEFNKWRDYSAKWLSMKVD